MFPKWFSVIAVGSNSDRSPCFYSRLFHFSALHRTDYAHSFVMFLFQVEHACWSRPWPTIPAWTTLDYLLSTAEIRNAAAESSASSLIYWSRFHIFISGRIFFKASSPWTDAPSTFRKKPPWSKRVHSSRLTQQCQSTQLFDALSRDKCKVHFAQQNSLQRKGAHVHIVGITSIATWKNLKE